jgi:hypothetical protein
MADIDAGVLCPIGLILVESFAPWAVFENHVVLVGRYERQGDLLTLYTYDEQERGATGEPQPCRPSRMSGRTPARPADGKSGGAVARPLASGMAASRRDTHDAPHWSWAIR